MCVVWYMGEDSEMRPKREKDIKRKGSLGIHREGIKRKFRKEFTLEKFLLVRFVENCAVVHRGTGVRVEKTDRERNKTSGIVKIYNILNE